MAITINLVGIVLLHKLYYKLELDNGKLCSSKLITDQLLTQCETFLNKISFIIIQK